MKFKKLFHVWDSLEFYLTAIFTTIATALAFYQVVMRYVFNNAPGWAEEMVVYLVVWAVFIISSKLVRDNGHLGADFLIKRMPATVQRAMEIANSLIALLFCSLVIYYGFQIVSMAFAMNEYSLSELRFPMGIAYLALPVGSVLIFLSYIVRLWILIFRFDSSALVSSTHKEGEHTP